MLATPERLSIDLGLLERRLAAESVKKDLAYWSLDTPVGVLSSFLCGEDAVREWTAAAPVNTDDLPLTQYVTGFTGTTEYGWPELAPKVESVWPYVSLKGSPDGYSALKSSLDKSVAARKILLEQNLAAALSASPADPSLLRLKDNLRRSDEYLKRLREIYGDDDGVLVTIAQRMLALCQYEGRDPASSFEPVAAVYRQAIDVNPRNVSALVNLGSLTAIAGSASEAQTFFENALAIDPSNVEAHLRFGTLLSDTEQYAPAIEHLERAAKLAPGRFDIENALAIALMATGNLDRAAALFEKAVVLSGQAVPDLYFNLGHVYAAKGDLDNALKNFRLASSANPSSAKYHLWLGVALLDKGDARAAEPEFLSALSADDANASAHAKLGTVYLRLGRLDDALAHLRKALALSPADPEAHEVLAKVLAAKRDFAGALGVLREGMRLQPSAEIAKELAWLLATCPDASLRNGNEALAIAVNLSSVQGYSIIEALDTLAAAYAEAGRFPEAVDAAQRALTRASIQNDRDRAAQIQKRLDLYRSARPYREP
jgi:tetratricopeptide (TPR) repeat protein